jgi:general secretion pathway protein D
VVRNTVPNVELVESLVEEAMKSAPKMVTVTVRILEVAQNNLDELGFDWLMGGGGSNPKVDFGGGTVGKSLRTDLRTGGPFASSTTVPQFSGLPVTTTSTLSTGVNPITAGLRSGQVADNRLDQLLNTGNALPSQLPSPGILSVAGVFTDPQFQTILRGVSQKKGVDVQASPSVTTKNGQKATIELQREVIYPTEFDPPQLPQASNNNNAVAGFFLIGQGLNTQPPIATPTTPTAFEMRKTGIVLEVEPVIGEDGSVELNLTPEMTDFEGFVNYGSPINRSGGGQYPVYNLGRLVGVILEKDQLITPNQILQPIFKTTKTSTSVRVWDGSTIMIGGLKRQDVSIIDDKVPILGDLPFIGRLFRTNAKQTETRNVVMFVTVDVIDPSGQKIRKTQTAAVAP